MKTHVFCILLLFFSYSGFAQDSTANRMNGSDEISISCSGTCACSLEGVLSEEGSHVSCTCNECAMEVVFTDYSAQGDQTTSYNLASASLEIPLLEEYLDFAAPSAGSLILNEITIYNNSDDVAVLFQFTDGAGGQHTVMFARADGKTFKINCEGECGCREVYSFETNSASCSCDDCIMTVEEVSNQ